ncbi:uncharacterized protein LOC136079860 isoform X1 [Hydra vulgaris]|uniref:Uncharacterized protein LOC136079860 isoform X1 n=1 Tax=Hydra vulgaris TaxID=6087 RepID=A0ABM4BTW3_HYDVU
MRKHVGVHVQACRKRVIVLAEEFHSSVPFSKELSMIEELRFDDLGFERKLDYMEKTSCSRRKWIVNCRPTFEDLLKIFPPLKDLAIHFQKDFCCNFPESNDFLAHWEQIAPHFISWARQKTSLMVKQILAELDMQDNPSIGIEMDFAFLLLPYIIKVPSKNKSCASAAEVGLSREGEYINTLRMSELSKVLGIPRYRYTDFQFSLNFLYIFRESSRGIENLSDLSIVQVNRILLYV